MAKFKIEAEIYVEADFIETDEDALSEVQVMLDDYDSNNPYGSNIIIRYNKISKED